MKYEVNITHLDSLCVFAIEGEDTVERFGSSALEADVATPSHCPQFPKSTRD